MKNVIKEKCVFIKCTESKEDCSLSCGGNSMLFLFVPDLIYCHMTLLNQRSSQQCAQTEEALSQRHSMVSEHQTMHATMKCLLYYNTKTGALDGLSEITSSKKIQYYCETKGYESMEYGRICPNS